MIKMKTAKWIPIVSLVFTVGCSNMNHTEQRALSSAAMGAASGAVIGGIANSWQGVGVGALVGAGVGLIGGLLFDNALSD